MLGVGLFAGMFYFCLRVGAAVSAGVQSSSSSLPDHPKGMILKLDTTISLTNGKQENYINKNKDHRINTLLLNINNYG